MTQNTMSLRLLSLDQWPAEALHRPLPRPYLPKLPMPQPMAPRLPSSQSSLPMPQPMAPRLPSSQPSLPIPQPSLLLPPHQPNQPTPPLLAQKKAAWFLISYTCRFQSFYWVVLSIWRCERLLFSLSPFSVWMTMACVVWSNGAALWLVWVRSVMQGQCHLLERFLCEWQLGVVDLYVCLQILCRLCSLLKKLLVHCGSKSWLENVFILRSLIELRAYITERPVVIATTIVTGCVYCTSLTHCAYSNPAG